MDSTISPFHRNLMTLSQNPSRRNLIATGAAVATSTLAFGIHDAAGAATSAPLPTPRTGAPA